MEFAVIFTIWYRYWTMFKNLAFTKGNKIFSLLFQLLFCPLSLWVRSTPLYLVSQAHSWYVDLSAQKETFCMKLFVLRVEKYVVYITLRYLLIAYKCDISHFFFQLIAIELVIISCIALSCDSSYTWILDNEYGLTCALLCLNLSSLINLEGSFILWLFSGALLVLSSLKVSSWWVETSESILWLKRLVFFSWLCGFSDV